MDMDNIDKIVIDGDSLTITDIFKIARRGFHVDINLLALNGIESSRTYVDRLVTDQKVVYGITTGFGEFSKIRISQEDTEDLQKNLIVSHACGVGAHLPQDVVRAVMLLRINALVKGFSGIRFSTLQTLTDMLNKGVIPAIPEKGSLGASGDLAPLAHMALPLIGMGEAYYRGELLPGKEAMARAGITPVILTSKEGLALINGTQVMTAIGALAYYDAVNLAKLLDISAALTMEALKGITDAYIPELHRLRPHKGQINTAENMLRLLENSKRTRRQTENHVQDAYSLRCVPQIHGASKDVLEYVRQKLDIEINSVTDNPIILADQDMAISCGNFHGQTMAMAFDFLAVAMAELANVSERRIERLVNPALSNTLPFLTKYSGLCSGFMIAQYAAAALVSENKILAHPASVDSIPSSGNQEDHVSMGTIAARKARDVIFNASRVAAIELLCAAQAIDLDSKDDVKSLSLGTAAAYGLLRQNCPALEEDRELYVDINKTAALIDANAFVEAVEGVIGSLET